MSSAVEPKLFQFWIKELSMATWYKADGTVKKVTIPMDPTKRLVVMQKCVGGDIEVIRRHENQVYLGNEEGRLLALPRNPFFVEYFYGDVLCVQAPEEFE
jgi:hypothetical protein